MKSVEVVCRGITALLIHRFGEAAETSGKTTKVMVSNYDPREEATKAAYINPEDKTFYLSAASIPGTMAGAGASHKMKGSRKSMRFVVPSAVLMMSDTITILDLDLKPHTNFEVDSRPVTIPATKGRVMRHRPRWNKWKIKFVFQIDDTLMSLDSAQQLLTEAGQSIGIGDFRPAKFGPFGRFAIESWKVLEDKGLIE